MDEQKINTILRKITTLAQGDFSSEARDFKSDDDLDAVLLGLDMLGEELAASTVSIDNYKAQKIRAEQANAAKSLFMANISHEIRTPLNAVIGFSSLLKETVLSEKQQIYVQNLDTASRQLLLLINDILDFERLNAGKMPREIVRFNLEHLVKEVIDMYSPGTNRRNVELILYYRPDSRLDITSDPSFLRQILSNLLSNAIKFTEKGCITVTIEIIEANRRYYARLTVYDTGIGLNGNPEDLFKEFVQADMQSTRKYGGSGLGLAIVRKLVDILGGTVVAKNNDKGGAEFQVEIPVELHAINPSASPIELKNFRVLIVDDVEWNRVLLHEYITSWGMRNGKFTTAKDALAALKEAKQKGDPYQIALLDYHMAEIDGMMLAQMIKTDSEISDTKLILLSSAQIVVDSNKLREIGLSATTMKPISKSDLMNLLINIVAKIESKTNEDDISFSRIATPLVSTPKKFTSDKIRGVILVVEDNTVNQILMQNILELRSFEVVMASNGKEAVEIFSLRSFDLILMDIQMPEMDGIEAMEKIRQLAMPHVPPIIALTANSMPGDREFYLQKGFSGYLPKPIAIQDLEKLIAEYLKISDLF